MTRLTRDEISKALAEMNDAFNAHDLGGVMEMLHEEVYFENRGK